MEMMDILDVDAVRTASGVSSKKRLLQEIADHAQAVYNVDAQGVFAALQNREDLGTTGVGHGVAIPHARLDSVTSIVGLFTRLENPVNFESLDKQPVDLVFTLLAPKVDNPEHLRALALVSRTLRQKGICAKLRANDQVQTIYSILAESSTSKAA